MGPVLRRVALSLACVVACSPTEAECTDDHDWCMAECDGAVDEHACRTECAEMYDDCMTAVEDDEPKTTIVDILDALFGG